MDELRKVGDIVMIGETTAKIEVICDPKPHERQRYQARVVKPGRAVHYKKGDLVFV